MKNAFKFLSLGVLMMAFYAVSATSILAQGTLDECNAIYERFKLERVKTTPAELRTAAATGKEYLQKCSTIDPPQDEVKNYVTAQIPKLEQKAVDAEKKAKEDAFNTALKAKNTPGTIAAAKELIAINHPYTVDLMLDIASLGFDQASAATPVDTYNNDAITYAKMAIQKMNEGATSGNADNYGTYILYKTKECPDGKANAIGWMNYTIGFITNVRQKQTKESLPYLYKATQNGCFTKTLPEAYRMIGAWYLDETIRLNNEYKKATEANNNVENEQTLAMLAMIKGYAERAMDAYARAYKMAIAPGAKFTQQYKDNLLKQVKSMADVRYGDMTKADAYIAEVSNKPFVDPATPVTPVVETAPATGTPTASNNLTSSANDTTAATTTRSTSSTGTGTATSTPAKTGTTTDAKKPAAKKPAPKKKGTR